MAEQASGVVSCLRCGHELEEEHGDIGGERWCAACDRPCAPEADGRLDGPLFLRQDGQRMDRHTARRVVKRICRRAGITKRISPHSLRHSAITAALDANVPLRDVQDFARHADPRTTTRYDRNRQNLDRNATYIISAFVAP